MLDDGMICWVLKPMSVDRLVDENGSAFRVNIYQQENVVSNNNLVPKEIVKKRIVLRESNMDIKISRRRLCMCVCMCVCERRETAHKKYFHTCVTI